MTVTKISSSTTPTAKPAAERSFSDKPRGQTNHAPESAGTGEDESALAKSRLPDVPSWLVSTVVHMVALMVLALVPLATREQPTIKSVTTAMETAEEEEPVLEVPDIDMTTPKNIEETDVSIPSLPDPGSAPKGETLNPIEANDAMSQNLVGTSDLFGKPDGKGGFGSGDFGKGRGNGEGSFFKAKARGKKFVFIVDNSTSMRDGRFETARHELLKAVGKLEKDQGFYVILFSDTSYPMFWPQPAKELLIATEKNKKLLSEWLMTVELCSGTKGKKAIEQAMALKPDVIFLLGDGAFSDDTIATANALNVPVPPQTNKISIHVLGMEVNDIERQVLKQLSTDNNGTYSDVELDPDIAAAAAANPIKRNRTRGPVWGVTLPAP